MRRKGGSVGGRGALFARGVGGRRQQVSAIDVERSTSLQSTNFVAPDYTVENKVFITLIHRKRIYIRDCITDFETEFHIPKKNR